ncbi:hypothetical protein PMAYCL1PPCAC_26338, partial [Pristionchus mayeri]
MHNWTIALSNKTATEAYSYFSEFLNSLLDAFVPLKHSQSSSGYPKYLAQLHDRLTKLHEGAPNSDATHSLRVRFDKALKNFESKREHNAVNSKNANLFFQFCKSRFKVNTSSLPGIVDSNGNVLLTDKEKANSFSKFFSRVQTPPKDSSPPSLTLPKSSFDLPFIPISDILIAISQIVPKCSVLHLGRLKTRSQYILNGNIISPKDEVRDLGIFFTRNLHFGHHIDQITRKARSLCNLLLRSFSISPPDILGLVNQVESEQREFTRRILGRFKLPYLPYPERLKHFQLDTLEYRRSLNDMYFLYDSLHEFVLLDTSSLYAIA